MSIDPTRAAFVMKPLRYAVAEDAAIKAAYPNAEEFVIDSQLSQSHAAALAPSFLNEVKLPARVFQVTIDTALSADNFTGGLPRYLATFPEFELIARTCKVISCEIDYLNDRTTMVVRG